MKRFLLSAWCAVAALSLFVPDSQAQSPGTGATGAPAARRHPGGTPEQHAREIIAKYDKDGDHALNATELAAFFEAIHQRVEERRAQQASNNTPGTPSASAGTGQRAAGSPQQHAAKAIEKFDKNGDGKLDAGELVALLTAIRERLGQHRGQGQGPGHTPATTTPATPTST
ncbi:MAG: EF-hand domain-containing protein [Chthoniobacter sp.]|nr:EF-hand domain-containing protein [Chthoniobacter sp.]